jgi:hypothetical protein
VIHQEGEEDQDHPVSQGYHPIGVQTLTKLVKIQLVSHGYTFVGKGTISVFVMDLQHEARMYGQLQRLRHMSLFACSCS